MDDLLERTTQEGTDISALSPQVAALVTPAPILATTRGWGRETGSSQLTV
jgi:hypothetical protein